MEALDDLGDQTLDLQLIEDVLLGDLRVDYFVKFEILDTGALGSFRLLACLCLINPVYVDETVDVSAEKLWVEK